MKRDRRIHDNLAQHAALMGHYIAEGMPRDEASKQALADMKAKSASKRRGG